MPDLSINLTAPCEEWVDATNPVFEGTPIEGSAFRVRLRMLTRRERKAVIEKHSKFNPKTKANDLDGEGLADDLFVGSVLDWAGFTDPATGKAVPCTETTKLAFLDRYTELAGKILAAGYTIGIHQKERAEAEEKNSDPSGAGS